MDEIREWQTQSMKHRVAALLIGDGVSFSYDEEEGIVFAAPESYVRNVIRRLGGCCGVRQRPIIINEIK